MFCVGEKALYEYFVWATEKNESEVVTVTKVVNANQVMIENSRGTIKRLVNCDELKKIQTRNGPFGLIM